MAENSGIEWTDHTFNPWRGCTKVSEGCANCYAERDSKRFPNIRGIWGPNGTRVVTAEQSWKEPLKWNRKAKEAGERHRVFCASLADVFEDWQGPIVDHHGNTMEKCVNCGCEWSEFEPLKSRSEQGWKGCCSIPSYLPMNMNDVRRRLFKLIDATPHLDWLLVTKRPENIHQMWMQHSRWNSPGPVGAVTVSSQLKRKFFRKNVWLLTSVENQEQADNRIPELLKCRDLSPVLGLSMEPLLDAVTFRWAKWKSFSDSGWTDELDGLRLLDWVIAGGESGLNARPMHPDWVRSIRDQCQAAGVPFFFKQWGEYVRGDQIPHNSKTELMEIDELQSYRLGKKAAGRLLDGVEWSQYPGVVQNA